MTLHPSHDKTPDTLNRLSWEYRRALLNYAEHPTATFKQALVEAQANYTKAHWLYVRRTRPK